MTEFEIIAYAKTFMNKLAGGINPSDLNIDEMARDIRRTEAGVRARVALLGLVQP